VDSRHEQRLIEVITDCFCSPTAGSAAAAENRRVVQALWQALTNAGVFEVSDLLHISAAILGHPTAHDDHREVWQSVQCASDLKHMWLIKFKQLVERLAKAAPAQATDAAAATSTSTAIDAAARVEKLTDEAMGVLLHCALTNSKRFDALDAAHRKALVDSCVESVQLPNGAFTYKSKLSWSLVDDNTKARITCPFCSSQESDQEPIPPLQEHWHCAARSWQSSQPPWEAASRAGPVPEGGISGASSQRHIDAAPDACQVTQTKSYNVIRL